LQLGYGGVIRRYKIDSILLGRYHAIYLEIPKVACTSIKTALASVLGISLEETQGDPHRVCWPTPDEAPSRSGPLFPGLFTFAFVRNPWDRLVSCYRDKIRGEVDGYTYFTIRPGVANCLARFDAFFAGMSFDEFVLAVESIPDEEADEHFRSQHTFVTNEKGEIAVDFVGRYERLVDDFRLVEQRIGLPATELPQLQKAQEPVKYASFYTPEAKRIVAERFRDDVKIFGYEFEAG
jgi:chondroitin 4-sulfotransferase 11